MYKLNISVESTRRGDILDSVKPVHTLVLSKIPTCPTAFNLDPYYQLKLNNGEYVEIGCSWSKNDETSLLISKDGMTLLNARSDGKIDIDVVLSDGLQYQFKLTKDSK